MCNLENCTAHGTSSISAGLEPLVEAGRVIFVVAGLARWAWQRLVGGMEDAVADWTRLHSFKTLFNIALPMKETIKDADRVRLEDGLAGKDPAAPFSLREAESFTSGHSNGL